MSFRFLPPAPEEARALLVQIIGSLVALFGLAWLFWLAPDLRPALVGAGAGLIYLAYRSAWALELKARRSQLGGVQIDEEGVRVHDGRHEQVLLWGEIKSCEVRGGKLWIYGEVKEAEVELSAREVEDGVQMVEEISSRWRNGGRRGFLPPSNFIPLSPR